jgi:hypothetical protein
MSWQKAKSVIPIACQNAYLCPRLKKGMASYGFTGM